MPYNGSGVFQLSVGGYPYQPSTTIVSANVNSLLADIASGLSNAVCRDGQSTNTGPLNMGGFAITGVGAFTSTGAFSAGNGLLLATPGAGSVSVAGALGVAKGQNSLTLAQINNSTAGTGAGVALQLQNDTYTDLASLQVNSSLNTSLGGANSFNIINGANAAPMAFVMGTTVEWQISTTGVFSNPSNSQPIGSLYASNTRTTTGIFAFTASGLAHGGVTLNAVSGTITIPAVAGLYRIEFNGSAFTSNSVTCQGQVGVFLNGTNISSYAFAGAYETSTGPGTLSFPFSFSDVLAVPASGVLSLNLQVTSGNAIVTINTFNIQQVG